MNLLPKSHKEFGQKDYWNSFFEQRGKSAFDWYGEYLELCSQLHKYIKAIDKILVTGCGNSTLSADLYDVGYHNIINIDLSEVVIKQMNSINALRNNMQFLVMDVTNTTFENETFSVILDKGTLDALMPDDSKEVAERVDKYFSEVKRLLRLSGRFICVTLLQDHILKKVLNSFDSNWALRIIRCRDAELKYAEQAQGSALPVFLFVATKFKNMPKQILEVSLVADKIQRLNSIDEVLSAVRSVQEAAMVTNGVVKNSLVNDNEVSFDLSLPGETSPRYTVFILDQLHHQPPNKYAAFIVPQGRELEWMFSTPDGRRELLKSVKYGRLLIVTMHRGHTYGDFNAVTGELADTAKTFAPFNFSGQIPFLSIGSELGKRIRIHGDTSAISGGYVIEDVEVDGDLYRRLIFLDNQFLIQSEAKIKKVKRKDGVIKKVIDTGYLACNHHSYMCVGVEIAQKQTPNGKAAVIGLGGGSLTSFLNKCFDNLKITAVDIDEAMLKIAVDYFDLKLGNNLKVVIEDGLKFLRAEAEKGEKYSAILFDVDSKDRSMSLSCPPKEFLEDRVLNDIKNLISCDGHFILNLVCREEKTHDMAVEKLKHHFKHVQIFKLDREVNEVLFCSNRKETYTNQVINDAINSLNLKAKRKKLTDGECVEVDDMMKCMSLNN